MECLDKTLLTLDLNDYFDTDHEMFKSIDVSITKEKKFYSLSNYTSNNSSCYVHMNIKKSILTLSKNIYSLVKYHNEKLNRDYIINFLA